MRKLSWILVVLLVVLSGCVTPKNINRDMQIDYFGELQQVQNRIDSLLYNMKLIQRETSEKLSNLEIENITTYFSAPDSTGRQYPTTISNTTVNKEEKENNTIDTKMEVTTKQLITEVDELKQRFNAAISDQEKVIEVSWWQLYKFDVYVSLFVIAVCWLIYKYLKRSEL